MSGSNSLAQLQGGLNSFNNDLMPDPLSMPSMAGGHQVGVAHPKTQYAQVDPLSSANNNTAKAMWAFRSPESASIGKGTLGTFSTFSSED